MKKVALFVEFKNGYLTEKSVNLFSKIVSLDIGEVVIYTFSKCSVYYLPDLLKTELVFIGSDSSISIIDKDTFSVVTSDFKNRSIDIVFALKSFLIDSLLSQLAYFLEFNIKSQIVDFYKENDNLIYSASVFNNKSIAIYSGSLNTSIYIVNNNFNTSNSPSSFNFIEFVPFQLNTIKHNFNILFFDSVINRVSLADAQIVVGAGRGLKDPTNWAIIEELASILNAATACSKPVSDLDWRPHYEHVGQTGVKIAPSVYIACGISGAIQHLAGVNSSKTIVVINNDPDAPFFTNADYGIIGDVFDIVPRLINKLKNR
jgi:electron transfer flavoprotein alpha subunit